MNNSASVARLILLVLFAGFLTGCTLANRSKWKQEIKNVESDAQWPEMAKGNGDAYLFDLKIYQEGRKNSVRLDIYWNGDSLGFYARGYLGKGVMKGILTGDALLVYFPTENEFYSGRIESLLVNNCFEEMPFERMIVDLFGMTPDRIEYSFGKFYLNILEEKKGERKYELVAYDCLEKIELEYDWHENRFIPEQINYAKDDGSFKFEAKRRKYRLDIGLPADKFEVSIPQTAARIYP